MSVGTGTLLAGRYRLTDRIAVGGMGEVWRGTDELLGRTVAVKVLKAEYADDADFLERFRAEARHTAALSHAGIANVFDYGEAAANGDAAAYLVMELVEGQPLSKILASHQPLEAARAMDIVGQAALALQAAHDAGVIHRDVKPGNIMVRSDGVVKVTDFGIARAADAVPLTRTGTVLGTAYYLSPEQATGRTVTPASDVYSLGVVGYECLTGSRPFPGPNPVAVATAHQATAPPPLPVTVPMPVRRLVGQALAKDPVDRPASAAAFGRAALTLRDQIRSGEEPTMAAPVLGSPRTERTRVIAPLPLPPTPPTRPVRRYQEEAYPDQAYDEAPRRDRRWIWALLLVALVAVAIIVGVLLSTGGGGRKPSPQVTASSTPPSPSASAMVTVPPVIGLSQADAEAKLRDIGLQPTTRRDPSSSKAAGTVTDQDPSEGASLATGETVTLTVSSKPDTVNIDRGDYVGRDADQVAGELKAKGLRVQLSSQESDQRPGTVLDVSPTGSLNPNTLVTLTVAKAKPSATPSQSPSQTPSSSSSPSASASRAGGGRPGA